MAPVPAQVRPTWRRTRPAGFISAMAYLLRGSIGMGFLSAFVRHDARQPVVAPAALLRDPCRRRVAIPGLHRELPARVVPDRGARRIGGVAPEPGYVALAIIRDSTGRIQLDGLERPHERPAQAEAVGDGMVEVLGAHVTLLHQAERFAEECGLQPVEDEAVDLLLHVDRHLTHLAQDRAGARSRFSRGPRRTAQPARANTCAQARPIKPAPTIAAMPMDFLSRS